MLKLQDGLLSGDCPALAFLRKTMFLKLSNDDITPGEGITDAIFFTEPQWNTAAGAAITYCVEILPAFDNGVYQAVPMTLL